MGLHIFHLSVKRFVLFLCHFNIIFILLLQPRFFLYANSNLTNNKNGKGASINGFSTKATQSNLLESQFKKHIQNQPVQDTPKTSNLKIKELLTSFSLSPKITHTLWNTSPALTLKPILTTLSNNKKILIYGTKNNTIQALDFLTGKPLFSVKIPGIIFSSLQLEKLSNGKTRALFVESNNGHIYLIDLNRAKIIRTFKTKTYLKSAVQTISYQGKSLIPVVSENFKINLVNIENGNTELILNTDETNYYDIQFILTPQGEWTAWLYSESKKTNSLIYLKTPHSITTIPDYPNKIHPVLLKKDHWLGIHISKNGMNVDILDLFSGDKISQLNLDPYSFMHLDSFGLKIHVETLDNGDRIALLKSTGGNLVLINLTQTKMIYQDHSIYTVNSLPYFTRLNTSNEQVMIHGVSGDAEYINIRSIETGKTIKNIPVQYFNHNKRLHYIKFLKIRKKSGEITDIAIAQSSHGDVYIYDLHHSNSEPIIFHGIYDPIIFVTEQKEMSPLIYIGTSTNSIFAVSLF